MQPFIEPGLSLLCQKLKHSPHRMGHDDVATTLDLTGKLLGRAISFMFLLAAVLMLFGCNNGDRVQTRTTKDFAPGDLSAAAARGDAAAVERLLASGANINENIHEGDAEHVSPLMVAIARGHEQVALLLIKNDALLYPTFQGHTAKELSYAAFGPHSEVTRLLESKTR